MQDQSRAEAEAPDGKKQRVLRTGTEGMGKAASGADKPSLPEGATTEVSLAV